MLTLRAAATRLAAVREYRDLRTLLPPLGFPAEPEALDRAMRRELGLPEAVRRAAVVQGAGTLRALLLDVSGAPLREVLGACARRVDSRAPELRVLLVGLVREPLQLGVAAWQPGEAMRLRVRSLLADPLHVMDSDAETFAALAAAAADGADPALTWLRWVEVLGREAIGGRFYRALERHVSALGANARGVADASDRRQVALLQVSRLLFLSVIQAKGWLDGDREFLPHRFDQCMAEGGDFHRRVLRPLFHGTLNTRWTRRAPAARAFGRIPFLNGGLFARTVVERRCTALHFHDADWGALFDELLSRYRFTAREERSDWSEAAVDPEMLGRAFESLMAEGHRRSSGSFYTPHALVARVTAHALRAGLESALAPLTGSRDAAHLAAAALDGGSLSTGRAAVRRALGGLTVLDPACGSGAFLVHALERLAGVAAGTGDARPPHEIRRELLTRAIFGVDRDATAAWLCELRLWLSMVIEREEPDPMRVPPLPNLDRNIRVGDALSGWDFGPGELQVASGARLRTLRERYARATGARKSTLARQLDREERARSIARVEGELASVQAARRELVALRRTPDLFGERVRPSNTQLAEAGALRARAAVLRREVARLRDGGALPFAFGAHFADVAARSGFSVVIGNPPWVRLHRIPADDRARWRREFRVFRHPSWEAGAIAAGVAHGFAGQVDLAALFAERAVRLLRPGGALALLMPVKLWQSLAGGGVRRLLLSDTRLLAVEDCAADAGAFDAAVYPSIVVATKADCGTAPSDEVASALITARRTSSWRTAAARLPLDATPGAPWLVVPPEVRRAFDRMAAGATRLSDSAFGRPLLGAKCGCNEAFLVELLDANEREAVVRGLDGHEARVERALLRPVLRGEQLRGWIPNAGHWILWTHDAGGTPIAQLPPLAARWFSRWRRRLVDRADLHGSRRWWSVFRVEGAAHDWSRVVWPDLSRRPSAVVLAAGDRTVPLNSCYVARAPGDDDAAALAALLHAPPIAAWLRAFAEPARGGYRRYLAWTMALLPIPAPWSRARECLAPAARAATRGEAVGDDELTAMVADAFRIPPAELEPLIAWAAWAA
ncbi:MAG: Eco57I restriction-modification methylase domain-containing protein [Gemmatimonadaceae bacterium]